MRLRNIKNSLKIVVTHPLNAKQRLRALLRYFRWQIGVRLVPGPVVVGLVNESMLLVRKAEASTLVVHTGLYDYAEMCFVLHCLRGGDVFVDVGANVGVYTVLASAVARARSLAFEPVPTTFADLLLNIRLNGIDTNVQAFDIALGSRNTVATCTTDLGAENRLLRSGEQLRHSGRTVDVRVSRLDDVMGDIKPRIVKVDVEGLEGEVLEGAERVLASDDLLAVIIELVGHGRRYGLDESAISERMMSLGFRSYRYVPEGRDLVPCDAEVRRTSGNVLYVRNRDAASSLAKSSPKFFVQHNRTWI